MAHTRASRGYRLQLRASWVWATAGVVAAAASACCAWPFTVDDAFIAARYAQNLAEGHGYVFQEGPASDGVTGPLWLAPLVLGEKLGFDAVSTGKWVGLGCALGAALLVWKRSLARAGGRARAPWLAALLGSAAPLWIWASGGLETAAATFFTTWLLLAASRRPVPAAWSVGLCAALLSWLRPELAPLSVFALAYVAARAPSSAAFAVGPALLGALFVLWFRQALFGHLLPLSAYAKPASIWNGAGYLFECLRAPASLALAPALCLGLARARRDDRVLALGIALHALALLLAGGDWMPGARLFVPIIPCACLLVCSSVFQLGLRRRGSLLWVAVLPLALRLPAASLELLAARAAGELREQRLPVLLTALAPYADPLALLDIGAVGYYSGRRVVDLGGLTEASIAYAPGAHVAKRIDPAWLKRQAPGAIVLHSRLRPRVDAEAQLRWFAGYPVERSVLAMPWVLRDYRVQDVISYDVDYFYVVLAPRAPARL